MTLSASAMSDDLPRVERCHSSLTYETEGLDPQRYQCSHPVRHKGAHYDAGHSIGWTANNALRAEARLRP